MYFFPFWWFGMVLIFGFSFGFYSTRSVRSRLTSMLNASLRSSRLSCVAVMAWRSSCRKPHSSSSVPFFLPFAPLRLLPGQDGQHRGREHRANFCLHFRFSFLCFGWLVAGGSVFSCVYSIIFFLVWVTVTDHAHSFLLHVFSLYPLSVHEFAP